MENFIVCAVIVSKILHGRPKFNGSKILPWWPRLLMNVLCKHSNKKQKDILEGSLDRVLLAVELEFPKILIPRLP